MFQVRSHQERICRVWFHMPIIHSQMRWNGHQTRDECFHKENHTKFKTYRCIKCFYRWTPRRRQRSLLNHNTPSTKRGSHISSSRDDHMMCLSQPWPTCQALLPLLSPDAGETASLHYHHQMMFPSQELLIGHFQFRVVRHQVDTFNKRSALEQCITVICRQVIYQTRETVFHWDIETLRKELKIWRGAEYVWRISRCLDSIWNTILSVW